MATLIDDGMTLTTDDASRSVHVAGELDASSAPRLYESVRAMVDRGATIVGLVLDDVTFLDSAGMRTIARLGNDMAERGGRLVVQSDSGAVSRTLEAAGRLDWLARRTAA